MQIWIFRETDRDRGSHTPSFAFRHFQGCRKPVLGVWEAVRQTSRQPVTETDRKQSNKQTKTGLYNYSLSRKWMEPEDESQPGSNSSFWHKRGAGYELAPLPSGRARRTQSLTRQLSRDLTMSWNGSSSRRPLSLLSRLRSDCLGKSHWQGCWSAILCAVS